MVPEQTLFDLGETSRLAPQVRAFRAALLVAQRLRYLMDDRLRADGLTQSVGDNTVLRLRKPW